MQHKNSTHKKLLCIALLLSMLSQLGYAQELGLKMQQELMLKEEKEEEKMETTKMEE